MAKDAFDVALAGFGRWVKAEPGLSGDPHGNVRELELLLSIMRDQLGLESPAALAPGHLQDLLLRAYVRKVGAGQTAETTAVVPALSDFFEYLAQNGDITADDADELDGRLEAVMRQFGSMAGDPTEMGLLDLRGAAGGVVGLKEAFALEDELPPLLLPPESQLADTVRRLPLLGQLTALTEWLGDDGRHVDEDLNLTPADAAEAAAAAGIDPASLPDLWDMALDSDFMDIADDRAVRDGDRDWRSRDDAEVVRLWQDLLGQVLVYTLTVIAEKDPELSEGLNFAGIGIGLAVLLFLARNEGMPVAEASDIVREVAIEKLSLTSEEEAERAWQAWIAAHGDPVRPLLDRLVSLGAASVTLDPEEGELIRLTHLGLYATRAQLVADGVDIPLLPEPEHLTASDLLGLGFSLPEEEFDAAMNRWLSGRAHETAAREVLAAGATGSVPDRMLAVGIAGDLGEAAAPAWRDGLDQLPLRGYAKAALARLDGKEFPDDLVLDDYAWITTDTLVGAGFGSPHDNRSAADVAKFLSEATPPGTEAELFEAMARLPHGQVADVLTVIGRSHPDKKLAKLARKAAYKATTRRSALSS